MDADRPCFPRKTSPPDRERGHPNLIDTPLFIPNGSTASLPALIRDDDRSAPERLVHCTYKI